MGAQDSTRRQWPLCPVCDSHYIIDIDPSEQGELLACGDCGHQWRLRLPTREPVGRQPMADRDRRRTVRATWRAPPSVSPAKW